MRHGLRITALLLTAVVVMVAAGCGGGKKVSIPTISIPTNPQTTPTVSSTGSFASAKNCLAFANLAANIASAMSPASGGGSSLQNSTHVLQAIAAAAPSAIKGDLQTVATDFGSYVQALQSSGYNPSQTTPPTAAEMAAIAHGAQVFSSAKFLQASHHLTAWEQQNCK